MEPAFSRIKTIFSLAVRWGHLAKFWPMKCDGLPVVSLKGRACLFLPPFYLLILGMWM